jgi:ATP-dependent helicase HrpB
MVSLPSELNLPVLDAVEGLCTALFERGCAVLAAPPGSGKTTVIPLALLDEAWLQGRKIVMLEPRRVAARAAARRMASLLGEAVGQRVGYQVRFERKTSAQTRIEVVTEGLLARRLQADPELPDTGLLIFDEFHERSLDADLALALALDARETLRPDLRVLVMSATLDTQRVVRLLDDAPLIESGGKMYPVDLRYQPLRGETEHGAAVAQGVVTALQDTEGDVLAFLPGVREIRSAQRALAARLTDAVAVCPLYGDLSPQDQDAALLPDAGGRRKVILATNLAQTSLTVEGVRTIVDGGLVRVARFDFGAGADRLETQRVSRASADQRAGRAGRLGPGVCYRLWSAEQHGGLAAHDMPEILAVDLTRFALELAAWGVEGPESLRLLDPPPATAWRYARSLLGDLGAIDSAGRITAHGRELARLPTAPRRGHMLLSAKAQGLAGVAIWVAAVLDERDGGSADLAWVVQAAVAGRSDPAMHRRVRDSVTQLARLIGVEPARSVSIEEIARVVAWGYPERIARRRPGIRGVREVAYLCADGGEARIGEGDPLAQSEWLAIAHWSVQAGAGQGGARRIRQAVAYGETALRADHAKAIRNEDRVVWDAQTEVVIAERQQRLGALVLSSRPLPAGAGDAVSRALLDGVRQLGLGCLPWTDETRQWQARVESLRVWRPDEAWPAVDDASLLAMLDDWLLPHLAGLSRRTHLSRLDLGMGLAAQLDYPQQQALQRLAPTHLTVPTGSRLRLEYRPPEAPALEVKLQEMFGCAQTPTVNEGRVPVVLHLLSPARRPVAVTQDLAGFWARGYADVRKDLRGRYPKHPWPDDPLSAAPTRRAKPRV